MKRDIIQYFVEWKNRETRKPLVVLGARQVGKTYAVEQFAKQNFENFLKINLEERPELCKLFESSPRQILDELTILYNVDFVEGKSILFIDEIQVCVKAIVSLRYFYEQIPNLHIIAAGSLLDHTLNEIQYSMPVGRIEFCYMYPLTFLEFLEAIKQENLAQFLKSFELKNSINPVIHNKILEYIRYYYFIGGMPEAVAQYVHSLSVTGIDRIHRSITTTLQYDFGKYGNRKQQENMAIVMKYCALNVGKKVKYVNIDPNSRSSSLKDVIMKLTMSRLVHLVKHTNSSNVPIEGLVNENVFKTIFLDIGLANSLGQIQMVNIDNILTANEGGLAEQFVGQELIASSAPYIDSNLYYWLREEKNSNAEIDYVIQYSNNLFPIEVKAGKTGTLKSLHLYLFEKNLNFGIRLNTDLPSIGEFSTTINYKVKQKPFEFKLCSLPIYLTSQLPRILKSII
jgi:hypothetical protein